MNAAATHAPPDPRTSPAGEELREIAAFFDGFVSEDDRWRRRNSAYHRMIASLMRFYVPSGASVLEIGSGQGHLLDALQPSRGVGIDVSPRMVAAARERHPHLEFECTAGESFASDESFDYVVLSDLVPYAHDLLAIFRNVARVTHRRSRVVIHSYSQVWRPVIKLAERLRLKPRKPIRNWVAAEDVENLLGLAGFEVITVSRRVLLPKKIPLVSSLVNGVLANVWPFTLFTLTYWLVARPRPEPLDEVRGVSVVVPCRNEAGTIGEIVARVPELGTGTEIVFVEGGSTDDTRGEIERQIAANPHRRITLLTQPGKGKADAVRIGFEHAREDVLMILDADLTVSPDDLPKFYEALVGGYAELVNGSRLVYDLDPKAMRFLNVLGNRVFSLLFSFLIGQYVKDTLCGTKVLLRSDYEEIAAGRRYFGDFDPFGDFDLLLGGARLGLKIVDLPVRYGARKYGTTNISRFRHGLLLLQMAGIAFRKFKFDPVRT